MSDLRKRAVSPDVEGGEKRQRTEDIEPFEYNFGTITAANLEDAIVALPRDEQLTDLNIAVHFCNRDCIKFFRLYLDWYRLRAFSQLDEHFLRMYQINRRSSRLRSQPMPTLARVVFTYQRILEDSTAASKLDIAFAAANKLIDYVIACYCAGETKIIKRLPSIKDWYNAAAELVGRAEPRATADALVHKFNRPLPDGGLEFSGLTGGVDLPHTATPNQVQSPNKRPITTGPEADGQDLSLIIESNLVDTSRCLKWDKIYLCPAVKLRIQSALTGMMRDNTVTQLERNTCNGMLLFGRPGTGKSILTYAMATKFGFKLYEVGMANVNGKWQGNSEKYVKALCDHAILMQPAMIFIDEIHSLIRTRSSKDNASCSALKATLLKHWSMLDHHSHRVVVVVASNVPDEIDPAFLARMSLRLRIRGPEQAERLMLLHDEITNRMYSSLCPKEYEEALKSWLFNDWTGADIRSAMVKTREAVESELYETTEWVKVEYRGQELYVPKTKDHSDCDKPTKAYGELTASELNMVSHRMIVYKDIQNTLKTFQVPSGTEQQRKALDDWGRMHGTDLSVQMKAVGISSSDISNW